MSEDLIGSEKQISEELAYCSEVVDITREILQKGYLKKRKSSTEKPRELHIELTYRCNLRCLMCDLWDAHTRSNNQTKNPELTHADIERLCSDTELLDDIETVVLSGGEPFLVDDFVETLIFFKKRMPKSFIWVLSNLYDSKLILSSLGQIAKRHEVDFGIGTSLDGGEFVHNKIRGSSDSFQRLMDTLKDIRREFPKVKFFISFTITPLNFKEIFDVYLLARQMDIPFSAQFSVERLAGRGKFRWSSQELDCIEEQAAKIVYSLISPLPKKHFIENLKKGHIHPDLFAQLVYWGNLVRHQREGRRMFQECPARSRFFMLSAEKEVYFCPILKYEPIGKTDDRTIDEIWYSEAAARLRRRINEGNCHCWLNCIVYPLAVEALSNFRQKPGEAE
ncbi:MAG: radical SAM protein [Candidatus Omnitrophota bacterium]